MQPVIATRVTPIENPGFAVRACYAIGRKLFGQVPTPEKLMAHRPALLLGIGGFYGAIEWLGTLDARLRALLQLHVAALSRAPY
ncbi:MAG TPA: hypothetical protein VLG10_17740 [Methylomirabilota bacterium]|nr:hypothetical protein [Methylomirabilota bacterium]